MREESRTSCVWISFAQRPIERLPVACGLLSVVVINVAGFFFFFYIWCFNWLTDKRDKEPMSDKTSRENVAARKAMRKNAILHISSAKISLLMLFTYSVHALIVAFGSFIAMKKSELSFDSEKVVPHVHFCFFYPGIFKEKVLLFMEAAHTGSKTVCV